MPKNTARHTNTTYGIKRKPVPGPPQQELITGFAEIYGRKNMVFSLSSEYYDILIIRL